MLPGGNAYNQLSSSWYNVYAHKSAEVGLLDIINRCEKKQVSAVKACETMTNGCRANAILVCLCSDPSLRFNFFPHVFFLLRYSLLKF